MYHGICVYVCLYKHVQLLRVSKVMLNNLDKNFVEINNARNINFKCDSKLDMMYVNKLGETSKSSPHFVT